MMKAEVGTLWRPHWAAIGDHYHEKNRFLGQGTRKYKGRTCPHQAKPLGLGQELMLPL